MRKLDGFIDSLMPSIRRGFRVRAMILGETLWKSLTQDDWNPEGAHTTLYNCKREMQLYRSAWLPPNCIVLTGTTDMTRHEEVWTHVVEFAGPDGERIRGASIPGDYRTAKST